MTNPMTPEEAAWIRENVWPGAMRKTDRESPGYYTRCACQYGPSAHCLQGSCTQCRPPANPHPYGYITNRRDQVLAFEQPYEHPSTIDSLITAPAYTAVLWLAGHMCRWICPHDCHAREQGALFDLAVTT